VVISAEFLEALRKEGMPVTALWCPVETANMLAVVAVKVPYANVAGEIANIIWSTRLGRTTPFVMVIDDDVDAFNIGEVFHTLMTKCHPYKGIVRIEHAVGSPLMPWADRYEREHLIGGRAYFDCTWPKTWDPTEIHKKSSLATIYPPKIQKKALALWKKYGY
jgi:4-hydroxy-3-polyprenylbenzoate decarboxylase